MLDYMKNRKTVLHDWYIETRRADGLDVIACRRCGTRETRWSSPDDGYHSPQDDWWGYDTWKTDPDRP